MDIYQLFASFSALTLLVWHQVEHPACENWVMRCWCGYLSGARCRLFVHGPADATAIPKPHRLLLHLNSDWFYLSGTGLPRFFLKLCHLMGVVVAAAAAAVVSLPSSSCSKWYSQCVSTGLLCRCSTRHTTHAPRCWKCSFWCWSASSLPSSPSAAAAFHCLKRSVIHQTIVFFLPCVQI